MTTSTHTPTAAPVALTAEGRGRLEQRLSQTRDEMAELDALIKSGDASEDHVSLRRVLEEHADELGRLLRSARDIADVEENPAIIEVGDEVDVTFDDGDTTTYAIVHAAEISIGENRISAASPLGRALLGRHIGDRIEVQAPAGAYSIVVADRRRLA